MTPVRGGERRLGRNAERLRRARAAPGRRPRRPPAPVSALALPLLITTARTPSPGAAAAASCTGAAWARLTVKQPAAEHGTSLTTSARSFRAGLIPAWSPAKRKPLGSFTDETPGAGSRPVRLGEPEHEVQVLHRLAGGALDQVVDGGDDHDPPRIEVGLGRGDGHRRPRRSHRPAMETCSGPSSTSTSGSSR